MIFINGRFLGQKMSGVQRFAYNIAVELSTISDVTIITPNIDLLYKFPSNVKIIKVGSNTGHLWEQVDLPRFLKSRSSPNLLNLCNTAPIIYKKNIYTLHDILFKEYPKSYSLFFRAYYNLSTKYHVSNSKHILTVSEFSKDRIIKYYNVDKNKITVAYNAVSQDIIDLALKKENNSGDSTKYIMTQAYFDENKNLEILVDAFKKIDLKNNIFLYLVGSNIEKDKERLESLLKIDNIKYCGRVTDEELVSLYKNALCYVIPSKSEGFGIPPLEAQACGCPVISSNTSALPEVVNDSALLFNPDSSDELYYQLTKIINDDNQKLRHILVEKGYQNISRFSYLNTARDILNILD